MTNLSNISTDEIKTIDLYISDTEIAFADICITHNEIFYCLGTDDMREDGHITIVKQKFTNLSQGIINAINNNSSNNILQAKAIKFKIDVTLSESDKISQNQTGISPRAISSIINCLSNECDEFIFLEGFKSLLT